MLKIYKRQFYKKGEKANPLTMGPKVAYDVEVLQREKQVFLLLLYYYYIFLTQNMLYNKQNLHNYIFVFISDN